MLITPGKYLITEITVLSYHTCTKKARKLKKEAKDTDISSLLNEWLSTIGLEYGYWGTLKRTKTAISTTGCKEYELLLPIPQIELVSCPTLIQNPGYM